MFLECETKLTGSHETSLYLTLGTGWVCDILGGNSTLLMLVAVERIVKYEKEKQQANELYSDSDVSTELRHRLKCKCTNDGKVLDHFISLKSR